MKSKINVFFFYFLGVFSCYRTKISLKIFTFSNFELVGTEEDRKILKSCGTKVITNDMKQLSGGGHIRFSRKRTFQPTLISTAEEHQSITNPKRRSFYVERKKSYAPDNFVWQMTEKILFFIFLKNLKERIFTP
jgi:hypothetical protein